ncbi:NADH-quinone oxidoreductase subunit M [Candidatus Endolissoclinum faulkneri]|uniref:NADH-quinone oxidoreductase subunit M n=1 Tax=Candidatus Endolissoclinum faulkneri TaxID=1263979 RepID=UPI000416AE21|nr:NADH-quinone oxidoreductase subunit M [Candidatus Endolissoclinum faulkneri]
MIKQWLLTIIIFGPMLGAAFIMTFRGKQDRIAYLSRWLALITSSLVFLISLLILVFFEPDSANFQLVQKINWIPSLSSSYHVGVDGISIWFIMMSTLLTPICILASWEAIQKRVREYMVAFLVLESMIVGMFCALDILLFYIFFEALLIPIFLIIGVWGGVHRVYAAFKFFLYTLVGSVLMLLAIISMYCYTGTTNLLTLMQTRFLPEMQTWLWLAFFFSFAVKVPMWPLHTWLPDAHVEAPTAGSVILAGILLKIGGYGFLRFSIPIFPDASADFTPVVYALSVISVIYTSLVALVQEDMKKMIAYSSVAHMGFVTVGIFTMNIIGVDGSILYMLSHGIVSSALFLCVGAIYDRMHTRAIKFYGGIAKNMPRYAIIFMLFMLASIGLPGTSAFIGELLILTGAFQVNTWIAAFIASGLILGAAYMLHLYRRVVFGKLENEKLNTILDLSPREIAIFTPLIILVFCMGIYPSIFTDMMSASVESLITNYKAALDENAIINLTAR